MWEKEHSLACDSHFGGKQMNEITWVATKQSALMAQIEGINRDS